MCGLLCMYNQNEDLSNQITTFNKMLSLIKHRGPDDSIRISIIMYY